MAPVRLQDVAERARVHPSTVSRALDPAKSSRVAPATRERVIAAARELKYRPNAMASGLRRGRSDTVGVVIPDFLNPFNAPVLRGIEHGLDAAGVTLLVTESRDDQAMHKRSIDLFTARRVDAVITIAARDKDLRVLRAAASRTPVVLAVRTFMTDEFPAVAHDDLRGGQLAADHLLALRHTRIAQLRGPQDVSSFVLRTQGFTAALQAAGLRELGGSQAASTYDVGAGYRMMHTLLDSRDLPTAVFAQTDLMAVGAIDALRERGLACPGDVSVVGYDDIPLVDHIRPPLTTVQLPGYQLGRQAAALALRLIESPDDAPSVTTLPPSLVERDSTAPPGTGRRPG